MLRKNNKSKGGFTLIELLATIAVLAVVVTIAIFAIVGIINRSKEKGYKATENNVIDAANDMILENPELSGWNTGDSSSCYGETACQYQCVTVDDLISIGYFKSDVLKSEVAKDTPLKKEDTVYIERDIVTKTITYRVFNSPVCSSDSANNTNANIDFSVEPLGWSNKKTITIKYKLHSIKDIESSSYSYSYTGTNTSDNSAKNNQQFTSEAAVETIDVISNGTLVAKINDDIEKTLSISQIDNSKPTGSIVSNHKLANNQTVTITMTDNEAGIKGFYFGKEDPTNTEVTYENVDNKKTVSVTKEVNSAGIWYLRVIDLAGNYSDVSKVTFYETLLSISNATVTPYRIIDENGATYTLPTTSSGVSVYSGYSFKGWYDNASYNGTSKTQYTINGNKTLYGKVTQNYVSSKSSGYITLSSSGSSMTYGSKSSLSFDIESSHGGSLSVTDNSSTVSTSISGKTVTLKNLENASVGSITVTVTCGATSNYTSASASYTLTINKTANTISVVGNILTYNGSAQELVTTSNDIGKVYYSTSTSLTSSNYSKGSQSIPKAIYAGSYTVYYYAEGNDNYESISGHVTAKINKATNSTTVSGRTLTYNGASRSLTTVSNKQGTVYYAIGTELTDSNYSSVGKSTIPTATNAGTYKVYYYVDGGNNYESKWDSTTATINKMDNQINIKGLDLNYTGSYQKIVTTNSANGYVYYSTSVVVTSSNRYSSEVSTSIPTKKDAGTYTVYYYVTGDNNHKEASGRVTTRLWGCKSGYNIVSGKCCPSGYTTVSGDYCVKTGFTLQNNTCIAKTYFNPKYLWTYLTDKQAEQLCKTTYDSTYTFDSFSTHSRRYVDVKQCIEYYGKLDGRECWYYDYMVCESTAPRTCSVLVTDLTC